LVNQNDGLRITEELKTKTFKMDGETEAHLVDLATEDERLQAAEVRFLINTEWQQHAAR